MPSEEMETCTLHRPGSCALVCLCISVETTNVSLPEARIAITRDIRFFFVSSFSSDALVQICGESKAGYCSVEVLLFISYLWLWLTTIIWHLSKSDVLYYFNLRCVFLHSQFCHVILKINVSIGSAHFLNFAFHVWTTIAGDCRGQMHSQEQETVQHAQLMGLIWVENAGGT